MRPSRDSPAGSTKSTSPRSKTVFRPWVVELAVFHHCSSSWPQSPDSRPWSLSRNPRARRWAVLDRPRGVEGAFQLLVGIGPGRIGKHPPRSGSIHERPGWLWGGPHSRSTSERQGGWGDPRTGNAGGEWVHLGGH